MQNKFFLYTIFLAFLGCSSEKVTEKVNAVNIFQNKNALLEIINDKTMDAKLDIVNDIKNISNAKSYNLINSSLKLPLKKKWQVDTNQSVNDKNPYLPDLIYLSQNIFLLNNHGVLFKIETKNGKILWKKSIFELEDTIIGTPAISGKLFNDGKVTIYAHNGFNEILAINGVNGKIIWKKKHRLPIRGGITSSKDSIFVGDFDGNFLSIDINNGKTNWNSFIGSDYNSVYTTARPIVAKDKIIVPGTGGAFFILSSDTGEVLWSDNISSNKQLPKIFHSGDIVANPIYHKGIIYVVTQSGFTSAFDINTSEELWNTPVGGIETPTLSGKTIFVNGHMGLLTAIDIDSGKLRWKKKYPSHIHENSLFSDKEIAIYKGPTLVDSKILLSDLNGKIYILDAYNGNEISTLKIDKLALPPIPANKNVFFLTANGKLLAYK